ncbi:unnamed protein product [Closterium sp. NIES-54]
MDADGVMRWLDECIKPFKRPRFSRQARSAMVVLDSCYVMLSFAFTSVCLPSYVRNIKKPPPAVVLKWISRAWKAMPPELKKKAFLTNGISNELDGSEDGLNMAHRRSQLTHEVDVDDEIIANGFFGNNCEEPESDNDPASLLRQSPVAPLLLPLVLAAEPVTPVVRRCASAQGGCPQCLDPLDPRCPFAVRYATHQLNLWPRVSVPETSPTLCWMGEVGDASVFRDVTFDESVGFYCLHPHASSPVPPSPLFLVPGPLPAEGGDPVVDDIAATRHSLRLETPPGFLPRLSSPPLQPVAVDSGAARGGDFEGADSRGAGSGGAASPTAESAGDSLAAAEWVVRWGSLGGGAWGAGAGGAGAGGSGAGGAGGGGAGAGGVGAGGAGAGGAGAEGARVGGFGGVGAGGPSAPRATSVRGAGTTAAGGAGGGCSRAGAGDPARPVTRGFGGATNQQQPSALRHLLSLLPAINEFPVAGTTPPLLFPPADPSQPLLLPSSPRPAPAPYTEVEESLTENRELASRHVTPARTRRAPRARPPPVPRTHTMAHRPSSVPQRVVMPSPPAFSLPDFPDPESDLARAASPTVTRILTTLVTDPSFASTATPALVFELVDFASACRLDYFASLVTESEFDRPASVGGELALGCDVLVDK